MSDNKGFISVELVKLEYDINKYIEEGRYEDAVHLIKENSELYEFDITISDKPAQIIADIDKLNQNK